MTWQKANGLGEGFHLIGHPKVSLKPISLVVPFGRVFTGYSQAIV